MWKEWGSQIRQVKELSVEQKKQVKVKKGKLLKGNIQKRMKHGGPMSMDNIEVLSSLNTSQLLLEMAVLRQTVSESIKGKTLVRVDGGKNFFRTHADEELRMSIKQVISPSSNVKESVTSLLSCMKGQSHYIGRRVSKQFGAKIEGCTAMQDFTGTVVQVHDDQDGGESEALFTVRYDDGDEEDYDEDELKSILLPRQQQ